MTSPPASTATSRSAPLRSRRIGIRQRRAALIHLAFLLATTWLLAACAPKSRPAEGPIGEQVEQAIASGDASFDHAIWNRLLAQGTRDGLVDYDYMASQREELDAYLQSIADARLPDLSGPHLMALLINAYNAYTVESILENPEVASIREIEGVWDTTTHPVGGHELTLDNIEHNLLRPYFKDPRIHMAVNCASMSCAPLPPWAFSGERLDAELEEWTTEFFNDPRYLRLEGDVVFVTKLLDWYGEDFVDPEFEPRADTLLEFAARYAEGALAAELRQREDDLDLRFMEYDWSLNRAR